MQALIYGFVFAFGIHELTSFGFCFVFCVKTKNEETYLLISATHNQCY